mmetsp:Transcript_30558/g.83978  ORF Transcript_30558/g.83978 Transcript_30558/m.83978 type:complete len:85 (+) Transcript_30558:583-837(+)
MVDIWRTNCMLLVGVKKMYKKLKFGILDTPRSPKKATAPSVLLVTQSRTMTLISRLRDLPAEIWEIKDVYWLRIVMLILIEVLK